MALRMVRFVNNWHIDVFYLHSDGVEGFSGVGAFVRLDIGRFTQRRSNMVAVATCRSLGLVDDMSGRGRAAFRWVTWVTALGFDLNFNDVEWRDVARCPSVVKFTLLLRHPADEACDVDGHRRVGSLPM